MVLCEAGLDCERIKLNGSTRLELIHFKWRGQSFVTKVPKKNVQIHIYVIYNMLLYIYNKAYICTIYTIGIYLPVIKCADLKYIV